MTNETTQYLGGRWHDRFESLWSKTSAAIARFPLATLLIATIGVLANCAAQRVYFPDEARYDALIGALAGAAAVSVAASLAAEAYSARSVVRHVLSLAAALPTLLLMWLGLDIAVYPAALAASVFLMIPLASSFGRGSPQRFWFFSFELGVGAGLAFLSVLLFAFGFWAILKMCAFLFEVDFDNRIDSHIFTTAFAFVGPLFALGRVPEVNLEREGIDIDSRTARGDSLLIGVRVLFNWVAVPLVLAAGVVLHLYAAKIVLSGAVPKNEIGWITLVFLALVLSLRVMIDPFADARRGLTATFAFVWAPMLLVPLGLMVFALAQRVTAEGVTEERYYLALAALAGGIVVLTQLAPRWSGDIRMMWGVPVALLLLSSFGPWGVVDIVGRSQATRIAAEFARNGRLEADRRALRRRDELRSRIMALADVGQLDRLAPLLDGQARQAAERATPGERRDAARHLLAALAIDPHPEKRMNLRASWTTALDLSGYDMALVQVPLSRDVGFGPQDGMAHFALKDGDLMVWTKAAEIDRFPLDDVVQGLLARHDGPSAQGPIGFDLTGQSGRQIRLFVASAQIEDGDVLVSADAAVLLRRAEWAEGLWSESGLAAGQP
ncbi:DUF4153 domain-containing protein [Consotaella salsifontis]|uniref:DUF4153 domain-containing protein n=1 Tax=Consotaella salsifontis TaxID=1365950 RepID=A0A1T4R3W0_9HYPH|nr:DUF4153 domain-containing protein [Consotaella salsifontis]SKA10734.1 protein of unknown function [Consotaella salsifontis]